MLWCGVVWCVWSSIGCCYVVGFCFCFDSANPCQSLGLFGALDFSEIDTHQHTIYSTQHQHTIHHDQHMPHTEGGVRPADIFGGPDGAIAQLKSLQEWFERQKEYYFYSSSVLIMYEGMAECPEEADVAIRYDDRMMRWWLGLGSGCVVYNVCTLLPHLQYTMPAQCLHNVCQYITIYLSIRQYTRRTCNTTPPCSSFPGW